MTETQDSHSGVTILDRIVETKRGELEALRLRAREVEESASAAPGPRDLGGALRRPGEVAVMAEVKRRSPGAGEIRPGLDPLRLARDYQGGGAAAISVLTDEVYFGGSVEDLSRVRGTVAVPVLRKDFVLDELQLLEARGAGADAVLLIVGILGPAGLRTLLEKARKLGMSALVEVHDGEELRRALDAGATLVGVNNRNLRTFETRLEVTFRLAARVPPEVTLVSESGIRTPEEVDRLGAAGVHAILVGESILRAGRPAEALGRLVGRPRRERAGA